MDIAIMYHYVSSNQWKGIVPIEPEIFMKQLEIIGNQYEIVSPDSLQRPIKSKPRCVLTFDDGTKDQYEVAFSILREKGIPGYFTIMSGPLQEKRIPTFHLVHNVLSLYSDEEIWVELNERFPLTEVSSLSQHYYSYESSELRRYNKYAFNFYLQESLSREFLMEKVLKKYPSVEQFIEQYYISKEEWAIMRDAGMTLGVHCAHHLPYGGDPLHFFETEIAPCAAFMEQELQVKAEWYTPAFGGGEKSIEMINELQPLLLAKGYRGGFTTIEGINQGLSEFWLNRYDCMNIPPFKKASILTG
jgi:hypothetical protein